MSAHDVRAAFTALAAANNSLLTARPEDVGKFSMRWADPKYVNNKKIEKSKGLWLNADGTKVVIPLIGVVDLSRSTLGAYGSCFWNREKNPRPTREDLGKSKFTVALTHPDITSDPNGDSPAEDSLDDLTLQIWNQLRRLDDIQSNAISALVAAGDREPSSTTDWVRFEENDEARQGWAHVSLGYAFAHASKRVKGKDLGDLSPKKPGESSAASKKKPDIEEDPDKYFETAGKHRLKHNDELPCFMEDGSRVGRTSSELTNVLFHGRWVRVDVELIMWNMVGEGKQVYQLAAKRMVALNCPPPHSIGGMAFAPLMAGSYKTIGGTDDVIGTSKQADGEDTLSDESSKQGLSNKRAAESSPDGEQSAKKPKA